MMSFLKSFFAGDKSADEQELQGDALLQRKRDVIVIDAYADDSDDEPATGGGCCGGGCGCR